MYAKPRTRPRDLVLPVRLARRPGAKARGLSRTVLAVRAPLGFSAISKTCWRCRQSAAKPSLRSEVRIPCLTGNLQGILANLGDMAEYSAESIRKISMLATNSLNNGTGNLIGVSGNFRSGTGNWRAKLKHDEPTSAGKLLYRRGGGLSHMTSHMT